MKAVIACAVIAGICGAVIIGAAASGQSQTGARTALREVPGCQDEDLYGRLVRMAIQQDYAAFGRLLDQHVADRTCVMWRPGDEVFVERTRWSGIACLRKAGDAAACYWTNTVIFNPKN